MTSSLNILSDEIFNIKEKLSNQEYLNICTHLANCYNEKEKDKKMFVAQHQNNHNHEENISCDKMLYILWEYYPITMSVFMIVILPIITIILTIITAFIINSR